MREAFTESNFRQDTLEMIEGCNQIIGWFQDQNLTPTLRQLYYQFVSRGMIENTMKSYNKLKDVVTKGRMTGMIDWDGIEDRTRELKTWLIEENEGAVVRALPDAYAVDMWENQERFIVVLVEKEALGTIVQKACQKYRVPYLSCKGYLSASVAYKTGQLLATERYRHHLPPLVIHLGDHDPSGIDMTRDNDDRLNLLSGVAVDVERIALNMDQIDEYNPPPNPAKETDSRAPDYIHQFGNSSWELDALEPAVLTGLIHNAIEREIDFNQWETDLDRERVVKNELRDIGNNYEAIKRFLHDLQ